MPEPALDGLPVWVNVNCVDGNTCQVSGDHWDELDAAYHNWYERHIDRVLALTCLTGSDFIVAASRISDILRSTPESRTKNHELEAAQKAARGFRDG